jgi:hypothetical protein
MSRNCISGTLLQRSYTYGPTPRLPGTKSGRIKQLGLVTDKGEQPFTGVLNFMDILNFMGALNFMDILNFMDVLNFIDVIL